MSKPKLTPWFRGSVKPARSGVYPVRFDGRRGFSYFTSGEGWGWCFGSITGANKNRGTAGATQSKSWRGLASNPKGKK